MATQQDMRTMMGDDAVGAIPGALARPALPWSPTVILGVGAALLILGAALLSGRVASSVDLLLPSGVILMVVLAFVNGSNDVSKAIATLVGSGVANYRRAIVWGTLCTMLGALCSTFFASALIGTFTKGFLTKDVHQTEVFALAVVSGAILWVLLATRVSMPVSTTHAITGSIVTVGAFAYGTNHVQWSILVQKVALPLLASPFLALVLVLLACLVTCNARRCLSPTISNRLHWLSSGTASFARGLNDTPKITALGVAFYLITTHSTKYHAPLWLFGLVAVGMGLGSFVGGMKVTRTLAEKVTPMGHTDGFMANLTTAVLVTGASNLGLPVSTTHVSSGSIIGIGIRDGARNVNWKIVRDMALAWVVTLPAAGGLGLAAYLILRLAHGAA